MCPTIKGASAPCVFYVLTGTGRYSILPVLERERYCIFLLGTSTTVVVAVAVLVPVQVSTTFCVTPNLDFKNVTMKK
jgi:hypothetical protein